MTTSTTTATDTTEAPPSDLIARTRRALPTVPLEHIRIASPCAVSWASMSGDEQRRHCGQCDRTVHDLSKMSRAEAEALVNRGEKVCVRLWVRRDGTVLTQDCPVGLARVRRHLRRVASILGALLGALVNLGCTRDPEPVMGKVEPQGPRSVQGQTPSQSQAQTSPEVIDPEVEVRMGDFCVEPIDSSTPTAVPPGR